MYVRHAVDGDASGLVQAVVELGRFQFVQFDQVLVVLSKNKKKKNVYSVKPPGTRRSNTRERRTLTVNVVIFFYSHERAYRCLAGNEKRLRKKKTSQNVNDRLTRTGESVESMVRCCFLWKTQMHTTAIFFDGNRVFTLFYIGTRVNKKYWHPTNTKPNVKNVFFRTVNRTCIIWKNDSSWHSMKNDKREKKRKMKKKGDSKKDIVTAMSRPARGFLTLAPSASW